MGSKEGLRLLEEITFNNYRCFGEHRLPLKNQTIIVGRNNAGKSTIIEGFRLVSTFCERYPNLNFQQVPDWLSLPLVERGMRADLAGLSLSWENLFHRYSDPPASVLALFSNGTTLKVHLGSEGNVHAVVKDADGRTVRNKRDARDAPLSRVRVLPQVAPLVRDEVILRDDYVRGNLSSYLAPQHFRNQLRIYYDEYFDQFKTLVESSWPKLQILELQGRTGIPGDSLGLLIRDDDFVAEIGWMGHGLQMWLQAMWFVTRTPDQATVVLDEPDVYMHPDLQRKLIRFLRGRFSQVIVATHSTEVLAEAEATDILVIDRDRQRSRFTTDLPAVQQLVTEIGSVQNIALTRLWSARRLLLVEGEDLQFLKRFHELVCPDTETPLDTLPSMAIEGWSGWPYAVGSAMLLRNAVDEEITKYCFLDRDFHTPDQIQEREDKASRKNVQLHIWSKKEIENFLVKPELIHRVIVNRTPLEIDPPTQEDVEAQIRQICEDLYNDTIDNFAQEFLNDDRGRGVQKANRAARNLVDSVWDTEQERISVVSGKRLISAISQWAQQNFQASFGVGALLIELRADEIDSEIWDVLRAVDRGEDLP